MRGFLAPPTAFRRQMTVSVLGTPAGDAPTSSASAARSRAMHNFRVSTGFLARFPDVVRRCFTFEGGGGTSSSSVTGIVVVPGFVPTAGSGVDPAMMMNVGDRRLEAGHSLRPGRRAVDLGDLVRCAEATPAVARLGLSGVAEVTGGGPRDGAARIGAGWAGLEELRINNGGSDEMLSLLCSALRGSLRVLAIRQCRDIGIRCVAENVRALTGLRQLSTSGCAPEVGADDAAALVEAVLQHASSMSALDVGAGGGLGARANTWVTDDVLSRLSSLRFLRDLSLAGCVRFSASDGLRPLCGRCSLLRSLDISRCEQVTEADLLGCLAACGMLQSLSVSYCTQLSDALVLGLRGADLCASLGRLVVYGMLGCFSDESLAALVDAKGVRIVGRVLYSDAGIARMLSRMREDDGRAAEPRPRLGGPADAAGPVAGAAARDGDDEHMRDTEAAEAFVRSVLVDLGDLGLRG